MSSLIKKIAVSVLCFLIPILIHCKKSPTQEEAPVTKPFITITYTVADTIQTYDPWTTGNTSVNEWAKPMYYIWFDMNGNVNDGPYGNGAGPKQAQFRLDTGRLNFWLDPDGIANSGDEIQYSPLFTITKNSQTANNIEAYLTNNERSFVVSFPLEVIGNPATLEMGFMASPWTTSASDNLGQGSAAQEWLVIANAQTEGTYTEQDNANDNSWPGALTPQKTDNFDLVSVTVVIEKK